MSKARHRVLACGSLHGGQGESLAGAASYKLTRLSLPPRAAPRRVHDNASIYQNKKITPADSTACRLAKVGSVDRPRTLPRFRPPTPPNVTHNRHLATFSSKAKK